MDPCEWNWKAREHKGKQIFTDTFNIMIQGSPPPFLSNASAPFSFGWSSIVVLGKEQLTLRQDIATFQKAYGHADPRIEGVRKANAEEQVSIAAKKEEHAVVEQAKVELREIIRSQTFTRADLESKLEELTRLKRREESLNKPLQDLKQELWTVDDQNQL